MSNNPFMDYQEQFFKMWNDNMEKMLDSEAYKNMTKNIPGADAYAKAMESMVPNVEKYWKSMASAMPSMPDMSEMPGMEYWNEMMAKNPYAEYWKNMTANMPDMNEYWKNMTAMMPGMDYWKNMPAMMPGMDYWKNMSAMMPNMNEYWKNMSAMMPNMNEYWKNFTANMPDMNEYWKNFTANMPDMNEYWKNFTANMPDMNEYWKNFTANMPDMSEYWKNMAAMMPSMDSWKEMMTANPFMDYWKNFPSNIPNYAEFLKSAQNMIPDMGEVFKSFTNMIPGMNTYWDNFAKMMPNPEMFTNMVPFNMPGLDAYTKVFDMWKLFGEPNAAAAEFQKQYMDAMAQILKSLFPAQVQPFIARPVDFIYFMIEYYKQFVSPWMQIEPEIMQRLAQGDQDATIDFFRDYMEKYESELEKYFTVMGMGLNREANEDYMKVINEWNKALIATGGLLSVIAKTGRESFQEIAQKVQADLAEGKSITTFRDFYNVWYSVTEASYEKLLATDEFARSFDEFSDRYAHFMIAQNKVLERMLSSLPIPTNTDMKALYKTVYDLRKDVRDLKKAAAAKDDKKGDK